MITLYQKGKYRPQPGTDDYAFWVRVGEMNTAAETLIRVLKEKRAATADTVDKHVFIFSARTGSGKSTAGVRELFEAFIPYSGVMLCTQPRIVLAIDKSMELPRYYYNLKLGINVGHKTSTSRVNIKDHRGIIFNTTRTLLNIISSMPPEDFGKRYPVVMIDECHEQNMEMLFTIRAVREYVHKHYDKHWCPLFVLASATVDVNRFLTYFGMNVKSPYNASQIEGQANFPIQKYFLKDIHEGAKRSNYAARIVSRSIIPDIISAKARYNDILIFGKGGQDIKSYAAVIFQEVSHHWPNWNVEIVGPTSVFTEKEAPKNKIIIIPIVSKDVQMGTAAAKYYRAALDSKGGGIKIFITSTLLESGATIPTLRYCIDGGWHTTSVDYAISNYSASISLAVSKAALEQRMGRIGRVAPGVFYGLYSEETSKKFDLSHPPASITSIDICDYFLQTVTTNTPEIFNDIQMMHDLGPRLSKNSRDILITLFTYMVPFDPIKNLRLIYPISIDLNINTMAKLLYNGLINGEGRLTGKAEMFQSRGISFTNLYLLGEAYDIAEFDLKLIETYFARAFYDLLLTHQVASTRPRHRQRTTHELMLYQKEILGRPEGRITKEFKRIKDFLFESDPADPNLMERIRMNEISPKDLITSIAVALNALEDEPMASPSFLEAEQAWPDYIFKRLRVDKT